MRTFATRIRRATPDGNPREARSVGVFPIGLFACLAQLLPAQVGEAGVGWISAGDKEYRKRFEELLIAVPTRDLEAGWRLARDLGRPVTPLLWDMTRAERSNVGPRVVLLVAAVLAGGPGEDDRLFEYLAQPRPMLEERVMAGMLLAMGPRRSRPVPDFWSRMMGPTRSPEQLLEISARLAAARFPGAPAVAPNTTSTDPGVLAASAYAGLPMSPTQAARTWRSDDRHAPLFRRGAMLGEAWRMQQPGNPPTLVDQAMELLAARERPSIEVRAAAMLLAARVGRLDPAAGRPELSLLQVAAGEPASRAALTDWLTPIPVQLDEHPERLAVAYALVQPIERILADRDQWRRDARIRHQLALALAMRLCAGAAHPTLPGEVEDVPEWSLCVWAAGGPFVGIDEVGDARLRALAGLIAEGRIDRRAAGRAIEDQLWRLGSHPGLAAFTQERLLLRDLMLSGSKRGGGQYQAHVREVQRYFPSGLDRSDEFFTIAVALFDLLMRAEPPIPAEYRLR